MSSAPKIKSLCRPGRPRDAAAICRILVESRLLTPALGDVERSTRTPVGEILTFVCEQNREIIGVLQWRHLGAEAEILDLAVRTENRRQGHASALLRHFFQTIPGISAIFLEVRESNAAAIALYQNFGFQVTGRRANYYRNPVEAALLMSLRFPA